MASFLQKKLEQSWYGDSSWTYLLFPIAGLFQFLSLVRKKKQQSQAQINSEVPVIVIGNIAVGGTGKTPLIIALAMECIRRGLKPGIISRGYGSAAPYYPFSVNENSTSLETGDEPLLIAKKTHSPVVIDSDRNAALKHILNENQCDLVLSDDGLQHYKLARQLEIAVIDGSRGVGNGFCLPVGPLRESPHRLQTVDCVVVNGPLQKTKCIPEKYFSMTLKSQLWRRVIDDVERELQVLSTLEKVHAVTGIGNPKRFFSSLRESNVELNEHVFPDHHQFALADINFSDELPVVMTAKDAVKCRSLLRECDWSEKRKQAFWYLPIEAQLPESFYDSVFSKINAPLKNHQTETQV